MAQLPSAFQSAQHEAMNDFSPIKQDGDYVCRFVKSEMKENKKKNGKYLELIAEVMQGDEKGKKIWVRLNLINPSVQAVEIANKELATIARATHGGMDTVISDSQQLHGKPFIATVKFTPATAQNPASNSITFYKPLDQGTGSAPQDFATGESAPASSGGGGTPDWAS